jgi:hypothetical protein
MKKKIIFGLITVLLLAILCFICDQFLGIPFWIKQSSEKNRSELAKTLQVDLDDYVNHESFPRVYFRSQLKLGMSIADVHKIMVGYLKVYNCYKAFGRGTYEVYYYIEKNDDYADVIEITYDDNLQVDGVFTSGPPSQSAGGHACEQGQIESK